MVAGATGVPVEAATPQLGLEAVAGETGVLGVVELLTLVVQTFQLLVVVVVASTGLVVVVLHVVELAVAQYSHAVQSAPTHVM